MNQIPGALTNYLNALGIISEFEGDFYRVIMNASADPAHAENYRKERVQAAASGLKGLMTFSGQGERQIIS